MPNLSSSCLAILAATGVIVCSAAACGSGTGGAALDGGTGTVSRNGGTSLDGATQPPPASDASFLRGDDGGADAAPRPDPDTPAVEMRVASLLAQMTQDEKVGQMVMVRYVAVTPGDVTNQALGAVLAAAGDAPGNDAPQDWLTLTNQYRAAASASRLQIPIIFGIDGVHGTAKVKGATIFPHDIGVGASGDTDLALQIEQATASEILAMGLTMSFSPDSDVGQDDRWGRTYESFGEDPALVAPMVAAAVTGYQGTTWGPTSLLACAKHFVGAGGTTWGTGKLGGIDEGNAELTEAEVRATHLPPFQAAIEAGALSIMVSYSEYDGTRMSVTPMWLTDVLKTELGFKGFLLSDYDAITTAFLGGAAATNEANAINAGLDMIMMSSLSSVSTTAGFISDVEAKVADGTIAQSRIDDAVTRILRAKVIAGLFEQQAPDAGGLSVVGSAAHRQIARKAASESMVLLQNQNAILPLSKSAKIAVVGPGANDVGVQSGGWTLGWMGVTNVTTPYTSADITGGTSIAAAMQSTATAGGGSVTYVPPGSPVPSGTTVGVVVLYENPYAEFEGDTKNPDFTNLGPNLAGNTIYDGMASSSISQMRAANVPMVLLLVTGRPVHVESYLSEFDAVVAAWLPGSEGGGVADVLFGDSPFVGKLPKSWPKDATVLPIVHTQASYDPLFAYGFGLN